MNTESAGIAPGGEQAVEDRLRRLEREVESMREIVGAFGAKSGYHELVNETTTRTRSTIWVDEEHTQKLYEIATEYDAVTGKEVSMQETIFGKDGRPAMKFNYDSYTHGVGPIGVAKAFHVKRVNE